MIDREKLKSHRAGIIAGILCFTALVNAGCFPLVPLNPNYPAELGTGMRLIVIVTALVFHKAIGTLEAVILPKWPAMLIGGFNAAFVLCGLACRYLVEFGEVSNTYNFTIANVVFQVAVLSLISTLACLFERKKY